MFASIDSDEKDQQEPLPPGVTIGGLQQQLLQALLSVSGRMQEKTAATPCGCKFPAEMYWEHTCGLEGPELSEAHYTAFFNSLKDIGSVPPARAAEILTIF